MAGRRLNRSVRVFKLRSEIESIRDPGFLFTGY